MRFIASLSFTKVCLATVLMLWVGNNVLSQEIIIHSLGRLESDLLCQGQRKNVTCKNSSLVMVIMSAVYGRTQEGNIVCPYRPSIQTVNETDDSLGAADRCGEHVVTETVERRCNKKYKCVLKVDRKLFGSPCLGVYKYLKIVYKCESREYFTPTSVISASPRSTLPSTEVTAPSLSSTTRKRRRRRTTSHSTVTSTKAPKTTILTSIMPVTTTVKATTKPTTRRTTTTPKTKTTTADYGSTNYLLSTLKTSTSEDTSALSTTKPTKHDLSTGIPVILKTNQTDNDTVEPTDRTTSTTIITTTLKNWVELPTTPRSTTPKETTTSQAPVLMPQDSQEVTWENSSTYLTIFLVSVFLAALIMALATFLVVRYKKRKRPHRQNILHKPKRYIDLPPKPKPNHSVHNNGHIPGKKPRKEGTGREDGSAPAKFSAKQSTIDSYPEIENEATKKSEEPNLHINPMFTKNGKMPHSSDGTSATSRTDGNMNAYHEKHKQFQRNTVDAPARGSCVNIESQDGGTRSCSVGNVSHGYTSNALASSQLKRRPSVGGIPYAAAGSKDGLSRYQSTGSGPLQRAVHGNKSPRQQDPSVWPKRQINGVETVSRQVATMPASYSGTTIHTVHMPLPGQTYSSSVSPSSSSRGAKHTVSSTNNQPYENAQATSAHRSYDQCIPTIQLNADKTSHPTSLSSRKAPSGEGQTSEANLPSIISNPEYDARAIPIYRKTYGSPGSVRAEKPVSNAGANSYGKLGRGKEQNTSCLIMPATNPSQTGDQGTRLTASSELVSPLDSMPAGTGTNTSRLRISDRHTSLSYGQAGHSFHPPPAPSHDTVCDSSDDDLYSIVSKGKHYSCAVTDPNLSVSQHSSTALPRHDEIKYVAVRVPRKV